MKTAGVVPVGAEIAGTSLADGPAIETDEGASGPDEPLKAITGERGFSRGSAAYNNTVDPSTYIRQDHFFGFIFAPELISSWRKSSTVMAGSSLPGKKIKELDATGNRSHHGGHFSGIGLSLSE
jgi:hypothetical protein